MRNQVWNQIVAAIFLIACGNTYAQAGGGAMPTQDRLTRVGPQEQSKAKVLRPDCSNCAGYRNPKPPLGVGTAPEPKPKQKPKKTLEECIKKKTIREVPTAACPDTPGG